MVLFRLVVHILPAEIRLRRYSSIVHTSIKELWNSNKYKEARKSAKNRDHVRHVREAIVWLHVPCWATSLMPNRFLKLLMDVFYGTTIPSRLSALKLRREANKAHTVDALTNLAFDYGFLPFKLLTMKPSQVREEIAELLRILKSLNPRTCLEIGTAGGGTLFLFAQVASPDATLISIDLPGGPFGGAIRLGRYPSISRSLDTQPRESTC